MTSAISPPRRLLALCSPRIQRTASTMLLLPEPLGPTMPVMPSPKSKTRLVGEALEADQFQALEHEASCKRVFPVSIAKRRGKANRFSLRA